jgi:formyl-CoA transferase
MRLQPRGSALSYRAFEAADGPIMIGVANDNLWRKFCAVAGL